MMDGLFGPAPCVQVRLGAGEGLVSAAIRTELRRLKADFDVAFSRLRRDADADDPDYQAARRAYELWRVAIDQHGLALLDELDARDAGQRLTGQMSPRSPVAPLTAAQQSDLRATFQEIDRMVEMRRLIEDA